MINLLIVIVFLLRSLTLVLSGLILRKSYQRFKQLEPKSSTSNSILLFGVGIFIFSLGEVFEEIYYEFTQVPLDILHTIEAILNAIGFLIIIYSIYRS